VVGCPNGDLGRCAQEVLRAEHPCYAPGTMGTPPHVRAHFAEKHIQDAARFVAAIEDNRFRESSEDRRAYEKFYNNLALFSGGTIALSVTFLGYLKALPKPIVHQRFLTGSWISLILCLIFSFAYVLCNLYYSHYFREREYAEALKKKFETEANEITHANAANIQTEAELAAFRNPRIEAARIKREHAEENKRKEQFYQYLWVWSGRLARFGFVIGLGLLVAFAILNT
jgi:hypothetical protein